VLQSGNGGGLKEIDSSHKLSLSGDDSTNLERFNREITRVFVGWLALNMSIVKVSAQSSLPALPAYKSWEESRSKKGLRYIIKRKMIKIKAQVRFNIQNSHRSHETTMLLAVTCLYSTCSFMTSLISYISDTYQDLADSKLSEEVSWKIATQLVNYIFANDMDKSRYFVREAMNAHSREEMAIASL